MPALHTLLRGIAAGLVPRKGSTYTHSRHSNLDVLSVTRSIPGRLVVEQAVYKGCPVTVMGLGINRTGYHGAFTETVEREIESVVAPPTLHLFSGRSLLGEERVDLERPEATIRGDVMDFVCRDRRDWEWVILDPPYEQVRKSKLASYAKSMSLAADVQLRRAVVAYLKERARNVLWVDYHVASIEGFERARLWVFVPGGLHPTVNMTWLRAGAPDGGNDG